MKIELNSTEIDEAIKAKINDMGINTDGKDVSVKFTAGRKENGNTAEVTIEPATETSTKVNTEEVVSAPEKEEELAEEDEDSLFAE